MIYSEDLKHRYLLIQKCIGKCEKMHIYYEIMMKNNRYLINMWEDDKNENIYYRYAKKYCPIHCYYECWDGVITASELSGIINTCIGHIVWRLPRLKKYDFIISDNTKYFFIQFGFWFGHTLTGFMEHIMYDNYEYILNSGLNNIFLDFHQNAELIQTTEQFINYLHDHGCGHIHLNQILKIEEIHPEEFEEGYYYNSPYTKIEIFENPIIKNGYYGGQYKILGNYYSLDMDILLYTIDELKLYTYMGHKIC